MVCGEQIKVFDTLKTFMIAANSQVEKENAAAVREGTSWLWMLRLLYIGSVYFIYILSFLKK